MEVGFPPRPHQKENPQQLSELDLQSTRMKLSLIPLIALATQALPALAEPPEGCWTPSQGIPTASMIQHYWDARATLCNCVRDSPGHDCHQFAVQFGYNFQYWGTYPTWQTCLDEYEYLISKCIATGKLCSSLACYCKIFIKGC